MDQPANSTRPLVASALEFERQALQRAGLGELADLVCIGPGADNVVRWAEVVGETSRPVVLVGLGGGLRATFPPGAAAVIATVIDVHGRSHRAPMLAERIALRGPRAIVACSAVTLTVPQAKAALAAKTGADLVDLESGPFALAGGILGWRWAIVRGVSDGLDDKLPSGIDHWVDEAGRTNHVRVLRSLATRPWELRRVVRLGRRSKAAMSAAAGLARELLVAIAAANAPSPESE